MKFSIKDFLFRGCLVYMFSLRFSGSNLYVKFIVHKVFRDLQSFRFVFKITI